MITDRFIDSENVNLKMDETDWRKELIRSKHDCQGEADERRTCVMEEDGRHQKKNRNKKT